MAAWKDRHFLNFEKLMDNIDRLLLLMDLEKHLKYFRYDLDRELEKSKGKKKF